MKPPSKPRTLLEYLGGRVFLFIARALPLRGALVFGECLGSLGAFVLRKRRRIAVQNILRAFPGISQARAEAMAVRVFRHFMRVSVEAAIAPAILTPGNFKEYITFHDERFIHEALDSPKGAIWITAHIGAWEIFSVVLSFFSARITSVYRPVKNPKIDKMLRRHRAAFGQRLVERKGALKTLLRVLRNDKGHVAMLVDQHARRGGIWVPFFGRPAATTPAPAILALRTGAPVVLWYSRRLPGTFRFEAWCDKPFTVTPTGDRARDIERVTRRISGRIEEFIRTAPDQWLWLHRRWRTPPPEITEKENPDVGPPHQVA